MSGARRWWLAGALALLGGALLVALLSSEGGEEHRATTAVGERPGATSQAQAGVPRRPGDDRPGAGRGPASDRQAAAEGPSGGSDRGNGVAAVDLTTDPRAIAGAQLTDTGAVQTLPPSEEAHETAQRNSYASIKAFGSEAEGQEATEITFALIQYLTATADGDWATACARLYGLLRENVEKASRAAGCPAAVGELMGRVSPVARAEAARIDVSSVRREGDRAFVIYKTPEVLSADMPMYLQDGAWTVGALEAYALTPAQLRENSE